MMKYLVLGLLVLVTASPSEGAIAFDAGSSSGVSSSSGTTFTFNHTTGSGSDRYMVGCVSGGNAIFTAPGQGDATLLSMSYNGVPMTPIAWTQSAPGTDPQMMLFGLAAPATGTHQVSILNKGSGVTTVAGVATFTGVDQTSPYRQTHPIGASIPSSGGAVSPGDVPAVVGTNEIATACYAVFEGCCTTTSITPGGGQTAIITQLSAPSAVAGLSMTYSTQASNTWTNAPTARHWTTAAITLKPTGSGGAPPIPALQLYERAHDQRGATHYSDFITQYNAWVGLGRPVSGTQCDSVLSSTAGSNYYDGVDSNRRYAMYSGVASWVDFSVKLREMITGCYYIPNNGAVPGYNHFTRGLWRDWTFTSHADDVTAIDMLWKNAAYSDGVGAGDEEVIRENAYGLTAHVMAKRVGVCNATCLSEFTTLRNNVLVHYDKFVVTRDGICTSTCASGYPAATNNYTVQPFMLALMARALIEDYEQGESGFTETQVIGIAKGIADFMWTTMQDPAATPYVGLWLRNYAAPADVFNLPAAWLGAKTAAYDIGQYYPPLFVWIALRTGDASYITKADALFTSGVLGAFQTEVKQFNQQYYWSLDYIDWRDQFYSRWSELLQIRIR